MRRGYETYVGSYTKKRSTSSRKGGRSSSTSRVSDDISSDSTLERELAPAWEAPSSYRRPKANDWPFANALISYKFSMASLRRSKGWMSKEGPGFIAQDPPLFSTIYGTAIARGGCSNRMCFARVAPSRTGSAYRRPS